MKEILIKEYNNLLKVPKKSKFPQNKFSLNKERSKQLIK